MEKSVKVKVTSRFSAPMVDVWAVLSDTGRLNENMGTWDAYTADEIKEPDGTIRRHASGKLGPLRVEWVEGFGEWVENRYMRQWRYFKNGPIRALGVESHFSEDGGEVVVDHVFELRWDNLLGSILYRLGIFERMGQAIARGMEEGVEAMERTADLTAPEETVEIAAAVMERVDDCVREIEESRFGHGLGRRLADFLCAAAVVDLKKIRPLAIAREWEVPPRQVIELFVAAQHAGLVAMRWEILCPRCRGAKAEAVNLYEMPQGVHCESCNIDYERDFAQNVELVFSPAAWLRELPEGEFCMMGAVSTPHVKVQRDVEPGEAVTETLELAAGLYRLRTVEPGGQCEVDFDGTGFPEAIVRVDTVEAGLPGKPGELVLRNLDDHRRTVVVEERAWTADTLRGPHVIAMQAFRELCPEQLLRPGDDVSVDQVVIMFTDLKSSTELYTKIGDSAAYGLVRDHFAFLAEHVRDYGGALVKTIGDSVMAAFESPSGAVRAAMAIQRDVAKFNENHPETGIILKIGLHQGPCIAVTTGDVLDYFGTTVNMAARLQGECRGDDVVLSPDVAEDHEVEDMLSAIALKPETAKLQGFADPVPYFRVSRFELEDAPA